MSPISRSFPNLHLLPSSSLLVRLRSDRLLGCCFCILKLLGEIQER